MQHRRRPQLARAIERCGQRAVDAYDVNSLEAIDTLAACGVPASRVRYIPNGVDTDFWTPADTPITDRAPVVVCAARLVPRKRQRDLIEAFAATGLASAGARLFLVGDGPERPRIEQRVREAGLREAVVVCGVLAHRELRDLYDRAVVAVLPSSWEGMPASILEARRVDCRSSDPTSTAPGMSSRRGPRASSTRWVTSTLCGTTC